MSLRRRNRARREGVKASIDMNSLIDLTFLLLVVFIVTLPTLEQSVEIKLPTDKVEEKQDKTDEKPLFVTVDQKGQSYVNESPIAPNDLKELIRDKVKADPENFAVVIRGDVRADYGKIYDVFKIARDCNVKKLALVSKEH